MVFLTFAIHESILPYHHAFYYRAFHGFGKAKFSDGGLILSSSQFSILSQLPQKIMLALKVAKINSKISNASH
jgi:hypothetical protein